MSALVGAGMVVRRDALIATGWPRDQWLEDRIGRRLVSGGDVEIAIRLRGVGDLWYAPACHLAHHIRRDRTGPMRFLRLVFGLGISSSLSEALTWPDGVRRWIARLPSEAFASAYQVLRSVVRCGRRDATLLDVAATFSYEAGRCAGLLRVARRASMGRCPYFGRAAASHPSTTL